MFRLSKLTDYAVVVLGQLCREDQVQTSPSIAMQTGIPEPTVAKVLKILTSGGLVQSTRGARGGYRLERGAEAITIADIIAAIDGPIAITACVELGACDCAQTCPMNGAWDKVNHAIAETLRRISLADMLPPGLPAVALSPMVPAKAAPLAVPLAAEP